MSQAPALVALICALSTPTPTPAPLGGFFHTEATTLEPMPTPPPGKGSFETTPTPRGATPEPPPPAATLTFTVIPERPRLGERYTVRVSLENEGDDDLGVHAFYLTTRIDGRNKSASVPSLAKSVPPGETRRLLEMRDTWKSPREWIVTARVEVRYGRPMRSAKYKSSVTLQAARPEPGPRPGARPSTE